MEPTQQVAQLARETRSSIELTRNARGEYQWSAKRYFDGDDPAEIDVALDDLHHIDDELRAHYVEATTDDS